MYNTFSISLKNPFHYAVNHLSIQWFYIELMVLNRTIPITKESLKNHLFLRVYMNHIVSQVLFGHRLVFSKPS